MRCATCGRPMQMEQHDGWRTNLACECGAEQHEWVSADGKHWIIQPRTWLMAECEEGALDLGIVRGSEPGVHNDLEVFFEEFTSVAEVGCAFIEWERPPCTRVRGT